MTGQHTFLRILGYILTGLLLALCVFLVICTAVFGSGGTLRLFGFNMYLTECETTLGTETIPQGVAVFVRSVDMYELRDGDAVLFTAENGSTIGYLRTMQVLDGEYFLTLSDRTITEGDVLGRAEWYSASVGATMRFLLSPLGILVVAVMPCVALVIFEIARAVARSLPPPEVEPKVKNAAEDKAEQQYAISVNSEGSADYSRTSSAKSRETGGVLYTRTGSTRPQAAQPASSPQKKPDIIPLTDRGEDDKPAPAKRNVGTRQEGAAGQSAAGGVPSSVVARRYLENVQKGATTELPIVPKRSDVSDAFFSPDKPRTARNPVTRPAPQSKGRSAPQLPQTDRSAAQKPATPRDRMAADIMADDDDPRDRSRYELEDILSSIEHHGDRP